MNSKKYEELYGWNWDMVCIGSCLGEPRAGSWEKKYHVLEQRPLVEEFYKEREREFLYGKLR
jgi:hypothetical protein